MPRIRGVEAHLARLKALTGASTKRELGAVLLEGGGTIATEAKNSISAGGGFGANHVVSRPGEPPNEEFGELNDPSNIYARVIGRPEDMHVQAVADAPHAVPLEGGTSKMAARPFMAPAAAKTRKQITTRVIRQLNRIIAGKRIPPDRGA